MKGRITAYDPKSFTGEIQGFDGERYSFALHDWCEERKPTKGKAVDFEPDSYGARRIYFDDGATAIVKQFPGPVELYPSRFLHIGSVFGAVCLAVLIAIGLREWWVTGLKLGILPFAAGLIGLPFAVGACWVFIAQTIQKEARLRLDEDGILHISKPFKPEYTEWDRSLLAEHPRRQIQDMAKTISAGVGGLSKKEMKSAIVRWCELAVGRADIEGADNAPETADNEIG